MIDVVFMDKSMEIEDLGRKLGFSKILFKEDIKSLNIVKAGSEEFNRNSLEDRKTDILLNPHLNKKKDALNYRNSGLNDVLCKLAFKNEIAIGFTFDEIKDEIDLGRIMQNIVLCRKYKTNVVFFTFARNKYEMKGCQDLLSFLRVIGFTPGEAKSSLENIEKLFNKKKYIMKGFRIVE